MIADPIERDETVLLERENEEAREQRWTEFVAWASDTRERTLADVLTCASDAYADQARGFTFEDLGDPSDFEDTRRVWDFAEYEGWPAVLSAIARAMKEQEAHRQ